MMSISDEKYLSLTTYRKNGEEKQAPVWIAELGDGTIGFTTQGNSWKCKRIRNDNRIKLQPCDQRGNVTTGAAIVTGTAELQTGAGFDRVRVKIKEKYGFMVNAVIMMNKLAGLVGKGDGDSDTAVVITLDS